MRILVIAVNTGRAVAVNQECSWALDSGAEVHLVTVNAESWPELDPRLVVHELRRWEGRTLLQSGERAMVFVLPKAVFAGLRRLLGKAAASPAAPVAKPALSAVDATESAQLKVANAFHTKLFLRFYSIVRPWLLWRLARRRVLPLLDLDTIDQVVVQDAASIALGWNIAKRYPRLSVTFELDRSRFSPPPSDDAALQGPTDARTAS